VGFPSLEESLREGNLKKAQEGLWPGKRLVGFPSLEESLREVTLGTNRLTEIPHREESLRETTLEMNLEGSLKGMWMREMQLVGFPCREVNWKEMKREMSLAVYPHRGENWG